MTGLVQTVCEALDKRCLARGKLNKDGCKVSLKDAPGPRLIIDFDKPGSPLGPSQTRCDYLFVADGDKSSGWVAPLELKNGRLHANQAVRQLRAGARAAEQLVPSGEQIKFRPVAVSGSASKAERNRLKGKDGGIRFHGCVEPVRLLSCGAPLTEALGK